MGQMIRIAMLLLFGCAIAGCAARRDFVATAQVNGANPAVTDRSIGTSAGGRPILLERFGSGSTNVLILAGIHGDERESVALAIELIDYLRANPQSCGDCTVSIIPIANPDGCATNTRVNGNGVDLNRNFPAANYKPARRTSTRASDQPETLALIRTIDALEPRLIISIHSITDRRECNNYDGPAEPIARMMST